MATTNTVWIAIILDDAAQRTRDLLDRGFFSEAKDVSNAVKALSARVAAMVQTIGGHAHVLLDERQILEVPTTFAEQLPNVIEGFKSVIGDKLACGMGLDFKEAMEAAKKSKITGRIELFGDDSDPVEKSDEMELPPNLFDPYNQEYKLDSTPQIESEHVKFTARMSAQESLQAETQYLQAYAQTLGAPSPQQQQQQMAQMQQQQQQQQQQPGDMLEALNGGPVEGHTPEKKKDNAPKENEPQEPEPATEDDDSEDDDGHEKLGKLLLSVKEKIPELMQLQDKNPEAFKNATSLIHKLINLARNRKKTKKTESSELEELQKALKGALHLKFPVGSVHHRKKKVIVRGKVVWRSMISGQVMGPDGQAMSVRESNIEAKKGPATGDKTGGQ